jgi:hypothetical protein
LSIYFYREFLDIDSFFDFLKMWEINIIKREINIFER